MNQQYQKQGKQPKREEVPRLKLDFGAVDIDTDLDLKTQLWCGEKKIGKTVNANRAGAYFLKFEAAHSHIKHHGTTIKDWNHMRSVSREIILQKREGKFPFNKICIDTLGECYKRCGDWILNKYGIMHEGDLGHGKGYSLIENAFREVIMPLSNAGLGVIFLAHTEEKELKDDRNESYKKAVAQMPKGCHRTIGGMVDCLLYFTVRWNDDTEKWERIIKTSPSKFYEAGCRYPEGWTRRLPADIPMSWEALKNAWDAGRPDAEAAPPKQEPAKPAPQQTPAPQEAKVQGHDVRETEEPPHPAETGGNNAERRTGTKLG